MDFKKAYEDALERAKGIYNENPSSSTAKFVCGQIFPEIKKSEDERIRKDIINYLSNELHNVKQLTPRTNEFEAWIAYLEKQKEQKPAEKQDYSGLTELERVIHRGFLCAGVEKVPVTIIKETAKECLAQMKPAEWSEKEKGILLECISALQNSGHWLLADKLSSLRPTWKPSERRQPSKPQLAEGVYYIKDSQPVAEYEDGVEIDRLLVIGRYCRFYLSMKDLGIANYKEAQNKAASLGEGWRCPDSFEGRTIGKMPKEIREKAAKIGAEHFKEKGWFWTNEVSGRWDACTVYFDLGDVYYLNMLNGSYVLALSAFQN